MEAWFDSLPAALARLAGRWAIEWEEPIPRGSVSVVIRCQAEGRQAVLKISPDRRRIAEEGAALACWETEHAAELLAVDESAGALLLEAVEPGEPLAEYPGAEPLAELIRALHAGLPSFRPVAERVSALFDSQRKLYGRHPELDALNEQAREQALRLADGATPRVLLHGDLTPVNVLQGAGRLVAIDPAPCVGDPAFDTVDFVFWQAGDVGEIMNRAAELGPAIGAEPARILAWCKAVAPMTALERADLGESVEPFLELARS